MVGIYKITNKINGKCYIGQSRNIENRLNRHRTAGFNPNDKCYNYPLYRAIRKYGLENFSFEVIEECLIEQLTNKELYWISHFNSIDNGYNQTSRYQPSAHYVKLSDETLDELTSDLMNTTIMYDQLSKKYGVRADYISLINLGKSWFREDLTYPLRNNKNKNAKFCIDCGVEIGATSLRCNHCNAINNRKVVNRPNREELKQLIKTNSFLSIGKRYGVSNTTIVKWCKKYNLPHTKKSIQQYSNEEWLII